MIGGLILDKIKILDNISEMVTYLDKDLNIKWVNKAVLQYFELPPKDLIGRKCFAKWGEKTHCSGCPINKAQKTKQTEESLMKKNDDKTWEMKIIPELNQENEIVSFIEIASDISQHIELIKVKSLLENLNNQAPGMTYQYQLFPDGSSFFPYTSDGINEIYEVTPEEAREDASKVYDRFHPDDYDDVIASIKKSAENLTVWKAEYRVLLPVRGLRWVEGKARPERLVDGSTLWHGNIHDITTRKNQELEIKKQKKKLDAIIKGTNLGTWEWNILTKEVIFNEEWAKMIGYTLDELKPTDIETWQALIHPEDLKKYLKPLKMHFAKVKPIFSTEIRLKHKKGHWVWVSVQGKVTSWTAEGEPEKMFGTIINISQQKEHEMIIKKLNNIAIDFQDLDNEEVICQKTIATAEEIFNFDLCGIALFQGGKFVPAVFSDEIDLKFLPLTHEILNKAYKNNKSYLNPELIITASPKISENIYISGLVIPIQDIGVFLAISYDKNIFTQEDLELAEILISHTKAALKKLYYQEELEYKSFHDSLTNLYNRRFFEEEMKRLDTERNFPISIIMADLNGLKLINDSFGHHKGDEVLVKTADILRDALREEDIIARQGGDEFAVLLPETGRKELKNIILRIKNRIDQYNMTVKVPVSFALGAATKVDSGEDIRVVLKRADNKMYQNKLSESKSSKSNIVQGLLKTLSAKSDETEEHALRMSELAHKFGKKLNLTSSEINRLSLLANMHDIGKASIPENILKKPGDLNDEEWEVIKQHSENGYKITSATSELSLISEEILFHHEWWDGNGYPAGIKGEEIPLLARIISIIDAYDVMVTGRPYQKAMSNKEALKEIERCAGTQFDPQLAKGFVELM